MEPFEFALMLVIQEKVLETVNVVSHVGLLQKKKKRCGPSSSSYVTGKYLQHKFEHIKSTTQGLAASWGISCNTESVALGSMCSFINTECKLNRQSSITGFKYNVDRAESRSGFEWRIRAGGEHSG